MDEPREGSTREVSEKEFTAHLGELYRDPERVAKVFEEGLRRREEGFQELEKELGSNQQLDGRMGRDPVGVLRDRGLLGPFDHLQFDLDFAGGIGPVRWPWPCIIRCHYVFEIVRRWICIWSHGLPICYPTFDIRVRRVCKLDCG